MYRLEAMEKEEKRRNRRNRWLLAALGALAMAVLLYFPLSAYFQEDERAETVNQIGYIPSVYFDLTPWGAERQRNTRINSAPAFRGRRDRVWFPVAL